MDGIIAWLKQLDIESLLETAIAALAALVCIIFHEISHGFVAYKLGDPTAKRAGRLSLNPLRHIDVIGFVCMVIFHFGWAKPVPVDARNFKHFRRDFALTALAGPISNLLLAVVSLTIYSGLYGLYCYNFWESWTIYIIYFFLYVGILSASLAVFNLFPIPPLDGSKVLFSFLPQKWYGWLLQYERYGFVLLAVLLCIGVLDAPLEYLSDGLLNWLIDICWWPVRLIGSLVGQE